MAKGEREEDFILGLRHETAEAFSQLLFASKQIYPGKVITVLQCMSQAQKVGLGNICQVCPQSSYYISEQTRKVPHPKDQKKAATFSGSNK